ncbi:TPA: site-specific integrase [Enterobacter hormaechei]|uniref:Arm DNA-binding domain-containing protein n=1 Tax=Enterobacter hormaechei TaxID=158836 RepID=UPI0034CFA39A|nr:site-specific integrase [Enterobacter hormaechei]HBL9025483.1 site-specific integrase [Enterobacter hormaechei]HBL9048612.1 site-specific integrase [Enterobacter hormaechei]HBL9057490.1 site-specific integrase [Enterobacter hormaechei]HBL9071475.1 site-specific integrase [Enterobacter hormaechei]
MGTTESPKLPRGVTIRKHRNGETINITFTYKGVKCREPLSNLDVTPKNIKYAERTLGEIYNKIERGTFVYAEYFPRSTRLKIFGNAATGKTVKMYLDEYLVICETRKLSPSTIGGYKKCRSALSALHMFPASELTPAALKTWIQNQKTTLKTIRNQLSFLRSALDEAVTDGVLPINPVSLVTASRYQRDKTNAESSYVVDPLSPVEIDALLAATGDKQWENLFRFAIQTGLRSSELCALRWSDIDFVGKTAHVKSASVVGVIKGTKTKAGTRKVELTDQAMFALINQKPFTFMKDATVFEDPKTNKPWASADAIRKKAWVPTLRKAGIRYRNPYQTRHTFATRHISQGINLFWLAGQMGHKGPEMLFRHYGSYLSAYDGHTAVDSNTA